MWHPPPPVQLVDSCGAALAVQPCSDSTGEDVVMVPAETERGQVADWDREGPVEGEASKAGRMGKEEKNGGGDEEAEDERER